MLSSEYTIPECKRILLSYDEYDFASDALFEASIEKSADRVKWEYLYDIIQSYYDDGDIQTVGDDNPSDRDAFLAAMTAVQRNIFFAEVYYICSQFLRGLGDDDVQTGDAVGTFSMEGYSQSDDGNNNSKAIMAGKYANKARGFMLKVGIDVVYSISRTRPRGIC